MLSKFVDSKQQESFVSSVSNSSLDSFDAAMRVMIFKRQMMFEEKLAEDSARFVAERLLAQLDAAGAWSTPPTAQERESFVTDFANAHKSDFMRNPLLTDIQKSIDASLKKLTDEKRINPKVTDPLAKVPTTWESVTDPIKDSLGGEKKDFYERMAQALDEMRLNRQRDWAKEASRSIYYPTVTVFEQALLMQIESAAGMQSLWNREASEKPGAKADLAAQFSADFGKSAFFWPKTKADLVKELDVGIRQLGWTNIWTQPIINRVDMLATGVRTQIGVKVFGRSLDQIQKVSNDVAKVLREIPGAVDVVPDQTIGKGYVEVEIDRERAARYGVNVGDIQDVIEVALGGKTITTTVEGRERFPVRLRYARDYRVDEESIKHILVSTSGAMGNESGGMGGMGGSKVAMAGPSASAAKSGTPLPGVYLGDVSTVRVIEGPVMIKGENGLLVSYVQLNVRDRDLVGFVEEAQRVVTAKVKLPEGCYLGWSGQFENEVRAKKTLRIVFPAVLVLIFLILYLTYNDFKHALLMMMAVPGALAGGVIFQTMFGYNFSVAVWVGYIACFGMATETGIIMLVYLRDAIAERGGLEKIPTLEALEEAIMAGAVHRLRPKLLTEGTAIVGLAPMLWAHGVGAEVMAPMATPVLGGLLIADEVIDIFLPVLFYQVEASRWKKLHAAKAAAPGPVELEKE
jgi:Cu(I)/Ag(I) efflux system membrane protein CusA/SilA